MATATDRRIIQVDVTTDPKAQKSIRDINSHLRSLEGSAKKTQREVTRMSRSFNLLSVVAKAYIALRVARAVTDTSDAMILLGARINIVTEETVGVEQAMSDLFDIAALTRQAIQATGTLYARLGFSTKALNLEHQQLLDIVQGVNNTLLLSGASAQESASSIIQLSQAFSKGSLDGDEFRSVSEGNVILFGIMQEVLGKTARELRQFSRDGKLSGDLLAQVLTSEQVKSLQGRVEAIPFTFAHAFTLIGNELSRLARDFEHEFSLITEYIVGTVSDLSTMARFVGAINDGRLGQFRVGDIFEIDIDTMEKELEKIKPLTEQMYRESKSGASIYREEIKRLNNQFNELGATIETLQTQTTGVQGVFHRTFQPEFYKQLVNDLEMEVALREATGHAIGLQRDAITLLGIEYDKAQAAFKKAREAGEEGMVDPKIMKEIDALTLSMRTAEEVYVNYIKNLERLSELGKGELSLETANRAGKKALDDYLDSLDGVSKATKEAETASAALGVAIGNTLANSVGDIGDTLVDFAMGLETSFRDTIASIIEDITRLIVKITLLNALKQGLGSEEGTLGGFLFPTASAKGNVFNQGNVTAFAAGGVVNSPTYFPMPNGVGLLGESGPEAILPLTRGSDGKLGVSTSEGSGPNEVTVVIENNGTDSTVTSSNATTDISGTVVNIVLDDIRRGGPIRDSVKNMREF